jgi:hypothetical protein
MAGHRWGFQLQPLIGCHERPRQLRWCGADQGASRTALNRRGVSHERGILTLSTGAAPAFGADWGRASISPNGPHSLVGSEFRWPRQAGSHRAKPSLLARSRCTRMLRTRGPQAAPAQAGSWRSRLAHAGARNRAAFRDHRRSTRSTTLARRRAGCWQGRPPEPGCCVKLDCQGIIDRMACGTYHRGLPLHVAFVSALSRVRWLSRT